MFHGAIKKSDTFFMDRGVEGNTVFAYSSIASGNNKPNI